MDVALRAGKIDKGSVAKTALLDSIIWFWFHQVSYESLFTHEINGVPASTLLSLIIGVPVGIAILIARWDRIPGAFRIAVPIVALVSTAALLLISQFALKDTVFEVVALVLFGAASLGCQTLRLENLAKCPDIRTLTASLVGSFLLFYAIGFVLLVLPPIVYSTFVILAPLVLIFGIDNPLPKTERIGRISKKTFTLTPNLLLVLFGIAGGFVFATGNISSAMNLESLFIAPSPTYLIMLLLYMELGILVAFGLRFRKAMYFVVMNMAWSAGSAIGALVLSVAPAIPDSLSVVLSAAIVVSFFVFQSTWIEGPKYVLESKQVASEDLARSSGLSNRETEVVLLLLEGRSLRHIQDTLYISEGTARTHVKRIYAKLEVHSKQELIDFFKSNV